MFERIRYRRIAREYFKPNETSLISAEDLRKILKGEIFNPRRLENPKNTCDYSFMVIGVPEGSPINSWAGQEWGTNCYELAQEQAFWYGKISAESESRIIITPNICIDFHYKSQSPIGSRIYISEFETEPWRFGGFMQIDKDIFNRTFVSNIPRKEVAEIIREIYSGQRNANLDLLCRVS